MLLLFFLTFFFGLGCWTIYVASQILNGEKIVYINRFVDRKLRSPRLIATDTARFFQVIGATLITTTLLFFYASFYFNISLKSVSSFYTLLSLTTLIWKKVIVSRYFARGGKAEFEPAKVENGKQRIELELIADLESGKILKAALLKNNVEENVTRIDGSLALHYSTIELEMVTHTKSGQEFKFSRQFITIGDLALYLENSASLRIGDFK